MKCISYIRGQITLVIVISTVSEQTGYALSFGLQIRNIERITFLDDSLRDMVSQQTVRKG